jgi:TetR/AcrR family transcriptional regulator, cholesterol catabolism regulator
MSIAAHTQATRRQLNPRQQETVANLITAAREELRTVGFDAMTIRSVAAQADVSAATAYNYFASKNHLVAEMFWRALSDRPRTASRKTVPYSRVVEVFQDLAELLAEQAELAEAITAAILSQEPDVRQLRHLIGGDINSRIGEALGPKASPDLLDALSAAWSGATMQVAMGDAAVDDLADRLARIAKLLMRRDAR